MLKCQGVVVPMCAYPDHSMKFYVNVSVLLVTLCMLVCCAPPLKHMKRPAEIRYYIVGRIRTAEIPEPVFNVAVDSLDPILVEKPIRLKITDAEHFEIAYQINGVEARKQGYFGKDLKTPDLQLNVTLTVEPDSAGLHALKDIDFAFSVKGE
ncbi:MAG: hypothetical protein ACJ77K_10345 [Bacteroidia bacterium]